jgi:hypothetical protein
MKIGPSMYQTQWLLKNLDRAAKKSARRKRFMKDKKRLYVWHVLEKLKQEHLEELRHDRK